ncbi:MAG: hypothetical protein QOJ64_2140 [Acidobacteriota bacterium]|jgi:hypothetical protein|nr:hypothetical protein [Acidobacteriota bacterium]
MNTISATDADYLKLNEGCDAEPMSAEYRKFHSRVGMMWLEGQETEGKKGIVPKKPFPTALPHLSLEFVLISNAINLRFDCGLMPGPASEAHAGFFNTLYGASNSGTAGAQQDGRWKEIKWDRTEPVAAPIPTDSNNNAPKSTAPPTIFRRAKRSGKRQADPFDPFSGLFY